MVGAEADTTTAVKTKAKEDSRVDNQATAAVAAIVVAAIAVAAIAVVAIAVAT